MPKATPLLKRLKSFIRNQQRIAEARRLNLCPIHGVPLERFSFGAMSPQDCGQCARLARKIKEQAQHAWRTKYLKDPHHE